jgi:RNA polymerase sigma-70 factor (ECF subfamily)
MADDVFATTHWSVVLAIGEQADRAGDEALTKLCQAYWPPLFAYLRRQGYSAHDAEDLVQGFFQRFMVEEFWRDVGREKGRFRSFLLASLRHHVANVHRHERTQRRGGSRIHVTLDEPGIAERCDAALATQAVPELVFDRVWAETVLAQAAAELRREYTEAGKAALYDVLRRWLAAEAKAGEYASVAPTVGLTEGALAVAVHRLRSRFQKLVRAQVAHTVAAPGDVEVELRHLIGVLTAP